MEPGAKKLKENLMRYVNAGLIVPAYELHEQSYVCFIKKQANAGWTYHIGPFSKLPVDLQTLFIGAYMNETIGDYKIVGVYDILVTLK